MSTSKARKQMDALTSNIFNLLNKGQKAAEKTLKKVKKYDQKEGKFILPDESEDKTVWSDLMAACSTGDVSKVSSLLSEDKEIDVNQQDDSGATALLLASKGGHAEIVQQLLMNGAEVDLQTNKGKSPLLKACKHGHEDVVKILLEHEAQVNMHCKSGAFGLIYASYHGHTKIVELLLDKGAAVNMKQSGDGASAL